MRRVISFVACLFLLFLTFTACHSDGSNNSGPIDRSSISTDTGVIAKGRAAFFQNCGGCHNFRQGGIGPSLAGLTDSVPADWIRRFIRDPKKMIDSGDGRAVDLYHVYKFYMPSFAHLEDLDIDAMTAFINTHRAYAKRVSKDNGKPVTDPIPKRIGPPSMQAGLKLITQVPASVNGDGPLARITKMDVEPSSGQIYIVDLRGKLYRLDDNKPVVYMDMAALRPNFIQEPRVATGFGSFAFHPAFAKNGILYTTHSEHPGSGKADFGYGDSIKTTLQWVLTEWKADNPGAPVFSGKGRELLRINMVTGMHGVQEISFNPLSRPGDSDYGLLYIGVGDGACVEEGYPFLAHSLDKPWGTILRIDPRGKDSRNGQYGIPPSNPFARRSSSVSDAASPGAAALDTLQEIYAYGFRNPHRITWTRTGQMLVCNIGQTNIESINLILPGHDYGWPIREGNFLLDPYGNLDKVYPLPADDSSYHITYPIAEYDHDEGKAICGGMEYWGETIQELKGKFLFGDIPTGRLFYIETADIKPGKQAPVKEWVVSLDGKTQPLTQLCKGDRVDLHFGRDSRGEIYILTKADGKVYKVTNATGMR